MKEKEEEQPERIPAGPRRQRQPRGPGGGRRWQRGSLAIPGASTGPLPAASSDSRRAAPGRSRGRAAIQPSRRHGPSPPLARPPLRSAPASGQGRARPARAASPRGPRPAGHVAAPDASAWPARPPRLPSALHRLRGHPSILCLYSVPLVRAMQNHLRVRVSHPVVVVRHHTTTECLRERKGT